MGLIIITLGKLVHSYYIWGVIICYIIIMGLIINGYIWDIYYYYGISINPIIVILSHYPIIPLSLSDYHNDYHDPIIIIIMMIMLYYNYNYGINPIIIPVSSSKDRRPPLPRGEESRSCVHQHDQPFRSQGGVPNGIEKRI